MISIIHKDCGEVAFYFRKKLCKGEMICASNVVNIDGTPAQSGDQIMCGSCGVLLHQIGDHNVEQKDQHWTDWFIIDD